MLHLRPDMASLATGSCNFPTRVYENPPDLIDQLAAAMREHDVKPEIEVFDLAMLYNAIDYVREGAIEPPLHVQFVLGVKHALPAERDILAFQVSKLREMMPDATWVAAGVGRHQLDVNRWCLEMGGHCRTGLEDNVRWDKDRSGGVERGAGVPRGGAVQGLRPLGRDAAGGQDAPGPPCHGSGLTSPGRHRPTTAIIDRRCLRSRTTIECCRGSPDARCCAWPSVDGRGHGRAALRGAEAPRAQQLFAEYPFSLGVASGDPLPDGVVLWTRLAPRPLENGGGMPPAPLDVAWEVARDRLFRNIEQKGTATAYPELAHSIHVEVQGLEPAREYFYRFRVGREISQIGRTRTAPAAGAAVDRLRFAVCGCSNYEDGYFSVYRRISEGDFDFVLHTGDYIYESRPTNGRLDRKVRQHLGNELFSITDYRLRYAQYKTDDDLRAAHQSAPFVMSWDDHEVANNYAGDAGNDDTPREVFLLRRAAAFQAYYEHMPLRRAAFPSGSRMQIYRRLQFGSLADLSVLDTRQYRSDQACGDGARTGCADAMDDEAHDARRRAGTVALRLPGDGARAMDLDRPAGLFLRARHGQGGARRPIQHGQVGWLRERPQPALRAGEGREAAEPDRDLRRRARTLRR